MSLWTLYNCPIRVRYLKHFKCGPMETAHFHTIWIKSGSISLAIMMEVIFFSWDSAPRWGRDAIRNLWFQPKLCARFPARFCLKDIKWMDEGKILIILSFFLERVRISQHDAYLQILLTSKTVKSFNKQKTVFWLSLFAEKQKKALAETRCMWGT